MQELQIVLVIAFITAIFYIATASIGIQESQKSGDQGTSNYSFLVSQLISAILIIISTSVAFYYSFSPAAKAYSTYSGLTS